MAAILTSSPIILSALAQDQQTAPTQLPACEPPWMSQLTDEQKEEIQQLTQSLRDSGASPQEIRDATNTKLQEWGIQVPELPMHEPPWMSQLTDEQKAELQQLLDTLKASGASPEETRDAIDAKLQQWGIEVPVQDDQQRPETRWMSQLTDEQKVELQQLVESLRESGATPEEIRNAINAKLQEWGIQLPAPPPSCHP